MRAFGIDIVEISAFKEQLELPGTRFANNFTALERAQSSGRTESLAGKWAAKEAFIKSWSMLLFGEPPKIARDNVKFSEIEVLKDTYQRPYLKLSGEVLTEFSASFSGNSNSKFSADCLRISITHDGNYAEAFCGII